MSDRFLEINNNREAVQRFVEAGGEGVELSEKQKELYTRWRRADELIRESFFGKFQRRENIVKVLMEQFDISRDTAYKDVVHAEQVFSSSAPLNKKYFIQRRIEFICDVISKLTAPVTTDNGKVISEIDEDKAEIAAKWEAVLQKYVAAYPDFIPVRSPKKIVYVVQNNLIVSNLTPEQAAQEADLMIPQLDADEFAG